MFLFSLGHTSEQPQILGRYSIRYALSLVGLLGTCSVLWCLSVPSWRAVITRRPQRTIARGRAWLLVFCSWVALLLSVAVLWWFLPADQNRSFVIFFVLLLELAIIAVWLWREGLGEELVALRKVTPFVFIFTILYLLLAMSLHGRLPHFQFEDETALLGSNWQMFHDPATFGLFSPDRNPQTFANNFSMLGLLAGGYMRIFEFGWLQVRAFYLMILWGAAPFIYGAARRLYGPAAALAAFSLAIVIPLQHNWIVNHGYVATATAVALYAHLRAREVDDRRRIWAFVCGFFAISAFEGHAYGLAFAAMFWFAQLRLLYLDYRRNRIDVRHPFWMYSFGNVCFLALWLIYHVALPGIRLIDLPAIIHTTHQWESSIGGSLTMSGIWKLIQLYLFLSPYEVVLLILFGGLAIWRWREEDRFLLLFILGVGVLTAIVFAHLNNYYFIFLLPFTALFFGKGIQSGFRRVQISKRGIGAQYISLLGLFTWFAFLQFFVIQGVLISQSSENLAALSRQRNYADLGRKIEAWLPNEDIVVAGNAGFYPSMSERLNYAISFSFTWGDAKYWPLDPPQAIIVRQGLDTGYSGLSDWLVEHEFQMVACFPLKEHPDDDEILVILYLHPHLGRHTIQGGCPPESWKWLS